MVDGFYFFLVEGRRRLCSQSSLALPIDGKIAVAEGFADIVEMLVVFFG